MDDFTTQPGRGAPGKLVESPDPPPLMQLSADERQVYDYICSRLREAGIEHLTAGMPIAVIVRTYADWLAACRKCDELGRTQEAKSGWHSPTPWAEDEKRLKMELSQWLPKACLTIPSLTRVRKDAGVDAGQDDLFSELVGHGVAASPPSGSRH
jgi:Phage terminase, small subunit